MSTYNELNAQWKKQEQIKKRIGIIGTVVIVSVGLSVLGLYYLGKTDFNSTTPAINDVDDLISDMIAPEPNVFEPAIAKLIELGAAAVPQLTRALADPAPVMRSNSAVVLGKIGSAATSATPALANNLRDRDRHARLQAVWALAQIGRGASGAVPALTIALRDEQDPEIRMEIPTTLGNIGKAAAPAVSQLVLALNDKAEEVRHNAAAALARIGPEASSAVPALVNAATTGDDLILRMNAIWALGKVGPKAAIGVPVLLKIIDQRDLMAPGITINAVRAVGEIGIKSSQVIATLQAAARDDNPKIAKIANETITLLQRR